jgi:hypothetical protein
MEQLWNRGGATGGKGSGGQQAQNALNQRETVATGCHRLPFGSHGKEGVSGSSPEEGSAKTPHTGLFLSPGLARSPAWPWVWSLYGASGQKRGSRGRARLVEAVLVGAFERRVIRPTDDYVVTVKNESVQFLGACEVRKRVLPKAPHTRGFCLASFVAAPRYGTGFRTAMGRMPRFCCLARKRSHASRPL